MSIDALKIATTISQRFIISGQPFTITTAVTNAHEDPIELKQFFYHIPYQVQWIHTDEYWKSFEKYRGSSFLARLFCPFSWKTSARPPGQAMFWDAPASLVLPGETFSYSFPAFTKGWLFSTGGEVTFQGLIRYMYKEQTHYSPFEVRFTIRPPLIANILGSVFGGILGTTAKFLRNYTTLNTNLTWPFVTSATLAVILGVVAVVYSSRRSSEVQPIITVEDFWGGMLVGFLTGYAGIEFFQKVVPISQV